MLYLLWGCLQHVQWSQLDALLRARTIDYGKWQQSLAFTPPLSCMCTRMIFIMVDAVMSVTADWTTLRLGADTLITFTENVY